LAIVLVAESTEIYIEINVRANSTLNLIIFELESLQGTQIKG